jgi:voltage-gated potassium channel
MSRASVRNWLGARAAIWLTTAVALLSFTTGVANISVTRFRGPLAEVVPQVVQQTAGFTGALTGFLMLTTALMMRRRLTAGWYATVVLLPMTAVQGLVQSSSLSVPLVVLSLLSLPTVLLNRRRFDRNLDLTTTQWAALAALVGTQVYAAAGAYALREQFAGVSSLTDAVYYGIITATTVGYGDVTPLSPQARLFGMSVVVLGSVSFAVALGSLLGPLIEARLANALGTMTDANLAVLEDHVLVLGCGDLTIPLLEELTAAATFVVVTEDPTMATELRNKEYRVHTADPSEEQPLLDAGIRDARAVITATNDDAEDALSILAAREVAPDIRIVAAATDRENVAKLRRAGADEVISPAVIGGHLLVESALERGDAEAAADRLIEEE